MSGSSDSTSNTYIWDCTAGKFNWKYSFDETACVLHGSVIVKDEQGVAHTLNAGDTMFFPAGSNADWHVPIYVRKVAFLRYPMASPLVLIYRIHNKLKRILRGDKAGSSTSVGF
jgi:uncharacterized cupin superfamily protein